MHAARYASAFPDLQALRTPLPLAMAILATCSCTRPGQRFYFEHLNLTERDRLTASDLL